MFLNFNFTFLLLITKKLRLSQQHTKCSLYEITFQIKRYLKTCYHNVKIKIKIFVYFIRKKGMDYWWASITLYSSKSMLPMQNISWIYIHSVQCINICNS